MCNFCYSQAASRFVAAAAFAIWLATGLTVGEPEPEGTEQLVRRVVPFDEALEMCLDGGITDAITVAALLRVKLLRDTDAR